MLIILKIVRVFIRAGLLKADYIKPIFNQQKCKRLVHVAAGFSDDI